MACAGTQSTLPPTDRDLASYAQSLGLVRLSAWYALERSVSTEAPLTTGAALTQHLIRLLEDARLVRPPQGVEPGAYRSLYEPVSWCYCADWGTRQDLQPTLHTALLELSTREDSAGAKLELWQALASAEIESYLGHLLRRHTLDPAGAAHIVHVMGNDWASHSLARKRYLAWFGARGAAAALLRTGMDQEAARIAMIEEMRRRSHWLAAKEAANALPKEDYCFMPDPQWKRPLLLEILITMLLPVGQAYWTERPQTHLCRLGTTGQVPR